MGLKDVFGGRIDSNQCELTVEYKGEGIKDLRFQARWRFH